MQKKWIHLLISRCKRKADQLSRHSQNLLEGKSNPTQIYESIIPTSLFSLILFAIWKSTTRKRHQTGLLFDISLLVSLGMRFCNGNSSKKIRWILKETMAFIWGNY